MNVGAIFFPPAALQVKLARLSAAQLNGKASAPEIRNTRLLSGMRFLFFRFWAPIMIVPLSTKTIPGVTLRPRTNFFTNPSVDSVNPSYTLLSLKQLFTGGCFYKLWGPLSGCPYNTNPTTWRLSQAHRFLETSRYTQASDPVAKVAGNISDAHIPVCHDGSCGPQKGSWEALIFLRNLGQNAQSAMKFQGFCFQICSVGPELGTQLLVLGKRAL